MGCLVLLTNERKNEIKENATEVNLASEKYQFIHATFAIEKILEDKIQQNYKDEFDSIRQQIKDTSDSNQLQEILEKAKERQKVIAQRTKTRIYVEYISQLKYGNARINKSANNNFHILLPKEMENVRDINNEIDWGKLRDLRKLMAHELGHIDLHSGILDNLNIIDLNQGPDDEADYFADVLINLRKDRNQEIYKDGHYESI